MEAVSGRRLADGQVDPLTSWPVGQGDNGSRGNRRPDDWQGGHFQVSGLGHQVSGSGAQVLVRVQEICPLSSVIDSAIHSALHAVLNAVLNSVICPLPSIQSSPRGFAALLSRRHELVVELEEGVRAVGVEKGEAFDELRIVPRNDVGLEGQAGFAEAAGAAMREFLREV